MNEIYRSRQWPPNKKRLLLLTDGQKLQIYLATLFKRWVGTRHRPTHKQNKLKQKQKLISGGSGATFPALVTPTRTTAIAGTDRLGRWSTAGAPRNLER